MLVTNPASRAPLTEVLSHPWMVRGFNGPPENYLLHREPLRADELDRQVIANMKGFEFGSDQDIERRLLAVLESEAYIRAVQNWERRKNGNGHGVSNSSLSISFDGSSKHSETPLTPKKSKRFSGFDFYRRKLFSPASSPPVSPMSTSPPSSQSALNILDNTREVGDPTRGFHPLISMYFLAREKLERERVYGPGQFASSQLSIHDPSRPALPDKKSEKETSQSSSQPTITAPPPSAKKDPSGKADYSMPLPRLPAPETSHYSGMSYDTNAAGGSGGAPVPSPTPTSPGFAQQQQQQQQHQHQQQQAQPRPRDTGLGAPPVEPSSAAKGLLPKASHRRSHSLSQRATPPLGGAPGMGSAGGPTRSWNEKGPFGKLEEVPEPPKTVGPEVVSFADKMEKPPRDAAKDNDGEEEPPMSAGATLVRKFGSMLIGGTDSVRRHHQKRATILGGGMSPRPSRDEAGTPTGERAVDEKKAIQQPEEQDKEGAVEEKQKTNGVSKPSIQTQQSQLGGSHRRAATILDPQGDRKRHERRSSTGAALLSGATSGGTIGRHRRPSTGYGNGSRPLNDRLFNRTGQESDLAEKPEEEENEPATAASGTDTEHEKDKDFKPVFLKGLFR
jgi:serine/threonine protein kinase KIN1/2